jgi:hypothetical protein
MAVPDAIIQTAKMALTLLSPLASQLAVFLLKLSFSEFGLYYRKTRSIAGVFVPCRIKLILVTKSYQ